MHMLSYGSAILVAIASHAVFAIAVPSARDTARTVVPGPGLPTLEELGLTSEELYAMTPSVAGKLISVMLTDLKSCTFSIAY